jgi:hypothetical protein
MGEAMSPTTINVAVPHTLGVEEAIARLSKGDAKPSMVKLTSVIANFAVDIPGAKVTGYVLIDGQNVKVNTDPLPMLAIPFDWLAENWIKAKLEELLK